MKIGWLVNDTLTCIPGTKTFWHDLLEWLPTLKDKCNGYTPFNLLPYNIEKDYAIEKPDYIIRNATYFRKLNIPVVALIDTNCDPDTADYIIPGNDDAIGSIKLVMKSGINFSGYW